MSSARFGRVVQRWWVFIAAVTGATIVAAVLWQLIGPVGLRAEAELVLTLNLPEESQQPAVRRREQPGTGGGNRDRGPGAPHARP